MTRMSKQGKRRAMSPRRPTISGEKTGPKKDALKKGFKEHPNAVGQELAASVFIPKNI